MKNRPFLRQHQILSDHGTSVVTINDSGPSKFSDYAD